MLSTVHSCAVVGLEGEIVQVEVDFNPYGMPAFTVVGLPDMAVQESRERVRAAIRNSGLQFPSKRYTVNLAPANLRKEGPAYDLPMAIGVLASTDQVPMEKLVGAIFVGELSLDGSVRHVSGILPIALKAWLDGYECIYVPEEDASQAALVPEIDIIPVRSLGHLVEHLYELQVIPACVRKDVDISIPPDLDGLTDFADVKGQKRAKSPYRCIPVKDQSVERLSREQVTALIGGLNGAGFWVDGVAPSEQTVYGGKTQSEQPSLIEVVL